MESRILKAIQPQLCLDPSPQLDKLSEDPIQNKVCLIFFPFMVFKFHIIIFGVPLCSVKFRTTQHAKEKIEADF